MSVDYERYGLDVLSSYMFVGKRKSIVNINRPQKYENMPNIDQETLDNYFGQLYNKNITLINGEYINNDIEKAYECDYCHTIIDKELKRYYCYNCYKFMCHLCYIENPITASRNKVLHYMKRSGGINLCKRNHTIIQRMSQAECSSLNEMKEKLINAVLPCDNCDFGSILDWIPNMYDNEKDTYLLQNCNPTSNHFGNYAISGLDIKKNVGYFSLKAYNHDEILKYLQDCNDLEQLAELFNVPIYYD